MKRKILFIIALAVFSLFWPKSVLAGCSNFTTDPPPARLIEGQLSQISFSLQVTETSDEYEIRTKTSAWDYGSGWVKPDASGVIRPRPITRTAFLIAGAHTLYITRKGVPGDYCPPFSYTVLPASDSYLNCRLTISSSGDPGRRPTDTISVLGVDVPGGSDHRILVEPVGLTRSVSPAAGSFQTSLGQFNTGNYTVFLQNEVLNPSGPSYVWANTSCKTTFAITDTGGGPAPTGPAGGAAPTISFQGKCQEGEGETALGCIPTDPTEFVAWVLALAIKIGGGIAFLLMLGGGFTIMTSSGNPEQLNKGKGIITAAVSGLLFIIFSVLLLKIIGIDILKIPGFLE